MEQDTAYVIGKIVGSLLGFACCLAVIIVPIVLLVRSKKKGKNASGPTPP